MAEHMSEMKKEYVDGLSTLPAADDQAAINTVVLDFLDFMFTKGFEKADIEQQLGDTRTAL